MDETRYDEVDLALSEDAVSPATGQRRASLRIAGVLLTVVLVVVMLLMFFPVLRGRAVSVAFGPSPTPTAPIPTGADRYYLAANIPWGSFTVDGKTVTHLPEPSTDAPLRLARGTHHITWNAPPFLPQTCVVSVPARHNDTCQPGTFVTTQLAVPIAFFASLTSLPDAQRMTLIQTIQDATTQIRSTTIYYPNEPTTIPQTLPTKPLQAALSFALDFGFGSTLGNCLGKNSYCRLMDATSCRTLCSFLSVPAADNGSAIWNAYAVAKPTWDYTDSSGNSIASNQPDGYGVTAQLEGFLALAIQWDGTHWRVSVRRVTATDQFAVTDIGCATAQYTLDITSFGTPAPGFGPNAQLGNITFTTAQERAAGCFVTASELSIPTHPTLTFLYRFGTYIAVNAEAQAIWPDLPRPDTYEQGIIRQFTATGAAMISASATN